LPLFGYRAINTAGEVVEGELDAGTEALVVERLQAMGFLPLETMPRRAPASSSAGPATSRCSRASWRSCWPPASRSSRR
jgi:general secretion pathway protein F